MVFPKLVGFTSKRCLRSQLIIHRKTIRVHAVGHGIGEKLGFGFRRIIRKPHALAIDVSFKEPKVNYSFNVYVFGIF